MTGDKIESKNKVIDQEFTTYFCPHCEKAFATGILLSVRMICPNCNQYFVIAGISLNNETKEIQSNK